jgi:hypothetical protein
MIHRVTATKPEKITNRSVLVIGYGVALWTAGIAVAQMVSFEEFVNALRDYHVVGQRGGLALGIGLLAIEIFSVPFWARFSLSPAARAASAALAAVLPFVWTFLTVSALVGNHDVSNAGYFGGFVELPVGMAVLLLDAAWMIGVAWIFGKLGGHEALRAKVLKKK